MEILKFNQLLHHIKRVFGNFIYFRPYYSHLGSTSRISNLILLHQEFLFIRFLQETQICHCLHLFFFAQQDSIDDTVYFFVIIGV